MKIFCEVQPFNAADQPDDEVKEHFRAEAVDINFGAIAGGDGEGFYHGRVGPQFGKQQVLFQGA